MLHEPMAGNQLVQTDGSGLLTDVSGSADAKDKARAYTAFRAESDLGKISKSVTTQAILVISVPA